MRPVRLDIDGFASYKSKTVIDFDDVDFFALVGPTGSGKSTILDALSFALYGSAPRWGNVNMVSPALAPTSNRALVRLIFDSAGQRYSVVRDVRRGGGKTQAVGIKEQRLERFHSPTDDGTGETDVLESDSHVTAKVSELLGLDFQDFCTCVALPQGEFAKFLHATRKDRQDILSKLLGHQIYERIGTAANVRAKEQLTRAETLTQQLAQFADGTDAHVEACRTRLAELEELERIISTDALPAYRAAAKSVAELAGQVDRIAGERTTLAAAVMPSNAADLQEARRVAAVQDESAKAAQASAEQADRRARVNLAAAPPRHGLEALRKSWLELGVLDTRLPELEKAAIAATEAEQAAGDAARTAADALTTARGTAIKRKHEADAADALAERKSGHVSTLAAVTAPTGLAQVAATRRDASKALDAARLSESEASSALESTQAKLGLTPDKGSLDAARERAAGLAATLRSDADGAGGRDAAASTLDALRALASDAEAAVRDAEEVLKHAELGDHVGALRTSLSVGKPCPVCEQVVHTLPRGDVAVAIDAARATVTAATKSRNAANEKLRAAERRVIGDAAARDALIARAEADRIDLLLSMARLLPDSADIPGELSRAVASDTNNTVLANAAERAAQSLADVLADRETLAAAADKAVQHARAARARVRDAETLIKNTEASLSSAIVELRASRESVLSLGAPRIDEADIEAAWSTLTEWVTTNLASTKDELTALQTKALELASARTSAEKVLSNAEVDADSARQASVDAALTRQSTHRDLTDARTRHGELKSTLDGQPDAEAIESSLTLVSQLEAACKTADDDLQSARQRATDALDALNAAAVEAAKGWELLRRTRDPLTVFGAPEVGPESGDLVAEWAVITGWAAGEIAARSIALDDASRRAEGAQVDVTNAEQRLISLLTDRSIADTAPPLAERVTTLLATERVRAEAALKGAQEHQAASARLHEQIDNATEQSQVARELALLMRSNNFPQWLVNSALDSLISEASSVLYELSGGQFDLTTEDGNLIVVDHNNADLTRPVKTLSGGETFQASLALALALSQQMSALAASGATKLEAIFLDEGFGTLDADTLDEVATTLENLAASGSRMVGVVTHVPALADRIPVRYRVHRDDSGSHVAMERA